MHERGIRCASDLGNCTSDRLFDNVQHSPDMGFATPSHASQGLDAQIVTAAEGKHDALLDWTFVFNNLAEVHSKLEEVRGYATVHQVLRRISSALHLLLV